MAWVSSCVAPRRRTSVSTSFSESSGRASAFVVASFMVAYSSASWACGWSCNNPGYAAFFKLSSTTFDHSSHVLDTLTADNGWTPLANLVREVRLRNPFADTPSVEGHVVDAEVALEHRHQPHHPVDGLGVVVLLWPLSELVEVALRLVAHLPGR